MNSNYNTVLNSKMSIDDESFDDIFSDGKYDAVTPYFSQISAEVETALNIEELNNSTIEKNRVVSSRPDIKSPKLSKEKIFSSVILLVKLGS